MKVVINAFSARMGGGQTYLRNLLAYIPDTFDIDVLVYAPDNLELPNNTKQIRMTTNWPITNPILRFLWERFVLPNILIKKEADILFCPGGIINTKVPKKCKTVTMFRNMIPFNMEVRKKLPIGIARVRNWLLERLMLKSMANADLTIFISDYARQIIETRIKLKSAVTIPHGISGEFRTYNDKIPRSSLVSDKEYILYVSRFDVYKHHHEIVVAYASLPKEIKEKYSLVLAGETFGVEAKKVLTYIRKNKLQESISILGAVSYYDLPALYHHAKLILFASSCENCPNILLESMGAGTPVLSSNIMPMPEFGGNGVKYFSPYDPKNIAKNILDVLYNPELAELMGKQAAARSDIYDWNSSAKETWKQMIQLTSTEPVGL